MLELRTKRPYLTRMPRRSTKTSETPRRQRCWPQLIVVIGLYCLSLLDLKFLDNSVPTESLLLSLLQIQFLFYKFFIVQRFRDWPRIRQIRNSAFNSPPEHSQNSPVPVSVIADDQKGAHRQSTASALCHVVVQPS